MQKYYNTLNKEEKRNIKELYKKEYKDSELRVRLVRLIIYAIIGYITSILIFIDTFLKKENIVYIIIAVILFITSTIFLVGSIILKKETLNKIALKNKK